MVVDRPDSPPTLYLLLVVSGTVPLNEHLLVGTGIPATEPGCQSECRNCRINDCASVHSGYTRCGRTRPFSEKSMAPQLAKKQQLKQKRAVILNTALKVFARGVCRYRCPSHRRFGGRGERDGLSSLRQQARTVLGDCQAQPRNAGRIHSQSGQ